MSFVIGREVRANLLPALSAIGSLMHKLASHPHATGRVLRKHHRKIPVPTVLRVGRRITDLSLRPYADIARMHGRQIKNIKAPVVATRPNNIIVKWISLRKSAFAATHSMPKTERY